MDSGILALSGLRGGELLLIATAFAAAFLGLIVRRNRPKHFNPYLLALVVFGTTATIFLLDWALPRTGGTGVHVLLRIVQATNSILMAPMRLYVVSFLGARDPWLMPNLNVFMVNGLIWGVVVERLVSAFSLRRVAV